MSKTKKIAGVDLPASSFAYVGDMEDPETWKLPLYIRGNESLTRNHVKNALYRFANTIMPDTERADVWRMIAGAAKAHGIKVPASGRPAPATGPVAHPHTAHPLDALDVEVKEAHALGSLFADRLLEKIEMEWVK